MFFLKELPSRQTLEAYSRRHQGLDPELLSEALHMLRQASELLRRLDRYFAQHGLSQLKFIILIVLDRESAADGLTGAQLRDRIDVSKPVITRTLQALADEALVAVRAHETDARAKRVTPTTAGTELVHRVLPGYYDLVQSFMRARDTADT